MDVPWPPMPGVKAEGPVGPFGPVGPLPRLPPSPLRGRPKASATFPGLPLKVGFAKKAIPKRIRGQVWKRHFGDSTKGACYCCCRELDAFDTWHAGHIVSSAKGGADTADNLRPLCASCNLSMGIENMDAFKLRCYPVALPL